MAQYDSIAKDYQKALCSFAWDSIVIPNQSGLLGDVNGKTALDLACGEGIYARYMKQHGANKVVGVDISPGKYSQFCF